MRSNDVNQRDNQINKQMTNFSSLPDMSVNVWLDQKCPRLFIAYLISAHAGSS